jgi:hypothetical protein
MRTIFKFLFFSLLSLLMISANSVRSQSALDQLNNINNNGWQGEGGNGTNVTVPTPSAPTPVYQTNTVKSTPSVSTPSVSTMVGGMIMQSFLNNLFAPTDNSAAEKAKQEAARLEQERIAAQMAEQKRIQDSIDLVKYNKLIDNSLSLPNSGNSNLRPLSLPTNPPPPLPPSQPSKVEAKHEYVDLGREAAVGLIGILAPNKVLSYGGIATADLIANDIKAGMDCFSNTGAVCPSTSTIFKNTLTDVAEDWKNQALGDVGEKVNGKIFESLALKSENILKGADMGFKEFRKGYADEVIPEIGAAHFKIVEQGVDSGNKIIKSIWGGDED